MFLATLAGGASGAERANVCLAARRWLRAGDERLGGSADGRGRSTGLVGSGAVDVSERADRVASGLRDVVLFGVGGGGNERRVSGSKRNDVALGKR